MKTALAAAVMLVMFGTCGVKAGSIVELGDSDQISSIIMLGDECMDCGVEEDVEVVDAGSAAGSSGALVDQYGMPTNMPVVMRPSMDAPAEATPSPDAAAPAVATPQTVETPQPEPVKVEPAPQEQAPAPEQPTQLAPGEEPK